MARVLVRTYVDPKLKARFDAQFPMQGSLSWALETALREILRATDGQPDLLNLVQAGMRRTMQSNRLASRSENAHGQPSTSPDRVF